MITFPYSSPRDATIEAQTDQISRNINELLETSPHLEGAIAGISIRDADSGKVIYQHHGNKLLSPASNLKLFTAAVSLSVLGPDYQFSTQILSDGPIRDGVLQGNLYIKGKGDPTLMEEDIQQIAKKLKAKGIKKVDGKLIGDDTWYDNERYSQDLPWTDEHTYYGAQVSALTLSPNEDYDAGTIIVEVTPSNQPGKKAEVSLSPHTKFVDIHNELETVSENKEKDIDFKRKHGGNKITVSGQIPVGSSMEKEWIAVWDPTSYVLQLFKEALTEQGIDITDFSKGKTPQAAKVLTIQKSLPLSELFIPFMKLSNNGHAELLIKELGRVKKGEGSWDKGLEVTEDELQKYKVNSEDMVMRDGSGISHVNLVKPNQLSNMLYEIQQEKWFSIYKNSLPIAGLSERMEGGTLRYRMSNPPLMGNVYAKTGTISTVSSLSGYIETVSGNNLIFSILLNNMKDEEKGKLIEDQIVRILGNI
ncbi:D-alanyl-D-alanine carboxypeptidase/D-alanyl-D-alanine endopeptidase [Salinibacillus kushneri]